MFERNKKKFAHFPTLHFHVTGKDDQSGGYIRGCQASGRQSSGMTTIIHIKGSVK